MIVKLAPNPFSSLERFNLIISRLCPFYSYEVNVIVFQRLCFKGCYSFWSLLLLVINARNAIIILSIYLVRKIYNNKFNLRFLKGHFLRLLSGDFVGKGARRSLMTNSSNLVNANASPRFWVKISSHLSEL